MHQPELLTHFCKNQTNKYTNFGKYNFCIFLHFSVFGYVCISLYIKLFVEHVFKFYHVLARVAMNPWYANLKNIRTSQRLTSHSLFSHRLTLHSLTSHFTTCQSWNSVHHDMGVVSQSLRRCCSPLHFLHVSRHTHN